MRLAPLLLAALSSAGCGRPWQRIDLAALPGATEYRDACGVILADDKTVRFSADARGRPIADVTSAVRVRILRDDCGDLTRAFVQYSPGLSSVTAFSARMVDPEGVEKQFERRDAIDGFAFPDWVLYSDTRVVYLDFAPVRPGSVLEWRHTVRYVDPELFHFSQRFGGEAPRLHTRLEVIVPVDWRVDWLARRLGAPLDFAPTVSERSGERYHVWERRDLAALSREYGAPNPELRAPSVEVRLGAWIEGDKKMSAPRDARALSAWTHELMRASVAPSPETAALAARILDGAPPDPAARARRLYAWTRDHMLYCSIAIGYGGWVPHPTGEVAKLRYGDCKDKANLLHAMLSAAGVSSRLATLWHHDGFPLPFGLPTLIGNFNHVILIVDLPGGAVVVDPTSRGAAFGELPVGDQDSELLPVAESGAPLEKTPHAPADANGEEENVELRFDADGDAEGSFTTRSTGAFAESLRERLLKAPAGARDTIVGDWLDVRRAQAAELAVDGLEPTELPSAVVMRGRFRVARALGGGGAKRLLRLSELVDGWVPKLPDGERADPLVLRFRRHKLQRLRLAMEGARWSVPAPVQVETPFGRYRLTWTADGDGVAVERELTVDERVVAAARYPAIKQFFDEILAAETRAVVATLGGT